MRRSWLTLLNNTPIYKEFTYLIFMKYLVHLRPPQPIIEYVETYRRSIQPNIASVSSNALHCTLMSARFHESDEPVLVQALETVLTSPFSLEMGGLDRFEKDSLVTRIQPHDLLMRLHLDVIEKLRPFIKWDEMRKLPSEFQGDAERERIYQTYGSPFYAQFYQPHISLCHVKSDFTLPASSPLTRQTFQASELWLSKKKEENWETVRCFPF